MITSLTLNACRAIAMIFGVKPRGFVRHDPGELKAMPARL
jgi:hypothetical protein